MFTLEQSIARDRNVQLHDQRKLKFALTALGYHDDTKEGLSPYSSNQFFDGIKKFQKDNKLKVDGLVRPEGETHKAIKSRLAKDRGALGAFGDFTKNYFDMREAKTNEADKYFHCKANYEATERGWVGQRMAELKFWARGLRNS